MPIGEWVLRDACRQAAQWRAAGHEDFVMAVNLSPRQLSSPDLAGVVAAALRDSGLPPSALCLEITESAIMEDPEAAHRILQGLRALGVRLAIDDFGVGYSSLSHLKYLLPVDMIKIDKSFVDGLLDDGETARSSPRSSSSRTRSACRPWPRAWRPRSRRSRCARWAATSRRATSSPGRSRRIC